MQKLYGVLLILIIWSCGDKETKGPQANKLVIPVTVRMVGEIDGPNMISASGKIEAVKSANLSTRIMGRVDKIHVRMGDKVTKGQLLLSINNTELSAKLAQVNAGIAEATAAYNNSEKDLKRFTALFDENSASQKELDDITANFNMAKARLEGARQMKNEVNAQFTYSNITAPFNGIVTSKNVEAGNMANPGTPLISIETPGHYEVMAMIPETEISEIETRSTVDVLVKSINQTLKGKVKEVSTSAKNTGGQYLVKIALDKTETKILSGMFTTVQFPVERKATSSMVLIPSEAIITKGQLSGIYTISQSNTAILRWLRIGRTFGDQVEVLSGLNADEAYIVSADGKLYNGAKISIK